MVSNSLFSYFYSSMFLLTRNSIFIRKGDITKVKCETCAFTSEFIKSNFGILKSPTLLAQWRDIKYAWRKEHQETRSHARQQ